MCVFFGLYFGLVGYKLQRADGINSLANAFLSCSVHFSTKQIAIYVEIGWIFGTIIFSFFFTVSSAFVLSNRSKPQLYTIYCMKLTKRIKNKIGKEKLKMPKFHTSDLMDSLIWFWNNRQGQYKKQEKIRKSLFWAQFLNLLRHLKNIHGTHTRTLAHSLAHSLAPLYKQVGLEPLYVSFLQLHCVAQC